VKFLWDSGEHALKLLKRMVGPWRLELQTSTVSKAS
jgi:hypothetical protein